MTGSLRILQIHNRYRQAGGEDAIVEAERTLLEESGYEVVPYIRTNPSTAFGAASSLLAAPWNPVAAADLKEVLRRRSPDIAHVHNTWFATSPSVISVIHRRSVPLVMTLHNYRLACINALLLRDGSPCEICVGTHPWNGVRYRCYRGSLPASAIAATTLALNRQLGTWRDKVGLFLVVTDFMRAVTERSNIPADRIRLVPNFVADPGPRVRSPSQSEILLFVGRVSAEKGIDRLVAAWERAAPSALRLVVVGEGPLRRPLEERGVPGVVFLGAIEQAKVRDLMLSARALLFPSVCYEGQPMVVLEAMSAGLGVIVSHLGGLPETVGEGGMAVRSWSDFAFEDLGDVDQRGRAARQRWEDKFTPAKHLEGLLAAYDQAAYWHNRRP